MKKCVKGFFTASIILNVLLLGLVGGHFVQMWQAHPWWEESKYLEPESQNHVAATFQNAFRDIREVGGEARKIRADMVKIISAEEFDEKAYDAAAEKLAEAKEKITAIKMQATKNVAKGLTHAEREKLAERMTNMLGAGPEKRVYRDRKPHEMGGPKDAPVPASPAH